MSGFGYAVEYWPGTTLVKSLAAVADDSDVPEGCGFIAEGSELPQPVEAPLTPGQVLSNAVAEQNALLASAALKIAPLQDATDLGEATDADTASLKLWKQYRVAVNRVPDQPDFPSTITWPTPPSE